MVGSPPISSKEGLLVLSFESPESPDQRQDRYSTAILSGRGNNDSRLITETRVSVDEKSKKTFSRTEFEDKRTNSASKFEFISVD